MFGPIFTLETARHVRYLTRRYYPELYPSLHCTSVDPNAVVVGGITALVSLAATASLLPDLVTPALGAAVSLAGVGLGSYAMTRSRVGTCPAGQCQAQLDRQCCQVVFINGRQLCPLNC